MKTKINFKFLIILFALPFFLISCKGPDGKFKLPGGDARKTPADPKKRIEQNLSEGKGFRFSNMDKRSGIFDFASSNELWRASLDVIEFMPLSSVNYSGGIIVTDWYTDSNSSNESIKISIRFLTNEIRSDALNIKIFNRKCNVGFTQCEYSDVQGKLSTELKKEILKKAAIYKQQSDDENPNKDYKYPKVDD